MQLAPDWPVTAVESAVDSYNTEALRKFLRARYEALFFAPLTTLEEESKRKKAASKSNHGKSDIEYWQFGFAITSLCCLLVETFQCYRAGLPSTHRHELEKIHEQFHTLLAIYPQYVVPNAEWPKGGVEVFRCFFVHNQSLFPSILGEDFYQNIRNGLLHQSQTKLGHKIGVSGDLWTSQKLNRVKLVAQLKAYFENYLEELKNAKRDSTVWDNARRKIWWLVQLSKA